MNHTERMCVPQAAAYLGVAESTLRNWICQGTAPRTVKIRGRRFAFKADLDKWIQENSEITEGQKQ